MMQYILPVWSVVGGSLGLWLLFSRNHWRAKVRRLETEANDAADRLVQANKDGQYQSDLLVALNERVDAQDELIASLTAQRDKYKTQAEGMARQMVVPVEAVIAWNRQHPDRQIAGLAGLVKGAYVHGPRGRLTRFVPKEQTVG